jgi:coenzyme F420-0:L-glutamate ligase/coenzyme F420-1:gamma-L-glutamate ligase
MTVEVLALRGIPEVHPGDDLALLLEPALRGMGVRDGDVLAVTQKIISKAEGRVVPARGIDWVAAESRRVVARREEILITETRHGFVCANACVDASNVAEGFVSLLPEDPDGSAEELRASIADRLGTRIGVVITDTFGRPWRRGVVNVAIGCSGLPALVDLRGSTDDRGRELTATIVALADEIAAASGLAMPKAGRIPAAIVRGISMPVEPGSPGSTIGASAIVRPPDEDLFRESPLLSISSRRATRSFRPGAVPRLAIEEAVRAACAAPTPDDAVPWLFVALESGPARRRLVGAMRPASPEDLDHAPLLILPFVRLPGHDEAEHPGPAPERDTFLLSSGAAIQGLLLGLHAQGLASIWLPSPPVRPEAMREALSLDDEWTPAGIVAAGWPPAESPPPGPPLDLPEHLRFA